MSNNINSTIAVSQWEAARKLASSLINQGYTLEELHEYKAADSSTIYWRMRLQHPNGSKQIRPMCLGKDGLYYLNEPKFANGAKPLYGLYGMSKYPAAQLWVVEGEKCVDALNDFFAKQGCADKYVAISSGSATSAKGADWSLVRNHSVVIFPDNDVQGMKYANIVTQILISQDCTVELIDLDTQDLPEKGDIVDWLILNPSASIDTLLALPKKAQGIASDTNTSGMGNETDKQAIKRLASLSPLEYDRVRLTEATKLGVRVTILDKEVKELSSSSAASNDLSSPLTDPEPWEDEVSPEVVLNELEAALRQFAVLPDYAYTIIPLWICHTWCIEAAYIAPILAICSPEKRCGKTTILSILSLVTKRALPSSNITPAAVFRSIEEYSPTLLIDEADTFLSKSDELRGILNSGHTRLSAYVLRTVGDSHKSVSFKTFGAKAIAIIGKLSDTLEDRAIVIKMRRKLNSEKVQKLHYTGNDVFLNLKRKLRRLADDNIERLRLIQPEALPIKSDRMVDNFEPLLAIASLASPEWLNKARNACLAIAGEVIYEPSIGVSLLMDIQKIFSDHGVKVFSEDLVSYLLKDEEKPWATYSNGKPITQRQVAKILGQFDIHSKTIRIRCKNLKGYVYEQFEEAFERYLPAIPDLSVTTLQTRPEEAQAVTDTQDITIESNASVTPIEAIGLSCDVVTDKNAILDDEYIKEERAAIIEFDGNIN